MTYAEFFLALYILVALLSFYDHPYRPWWKDVIVALLWPVITVIGGIVWIRQKFNR